MCTHMTKITIFNFWGKIDKIVNSISMTFHIRRAQRRNGIVDAMACLRFYFHLCPYQSICYYYYCAVHPFLYRITLRCALCTTYGRMVDSRNGHLAVLRWQFMCLVLHILCIRPFLNKWSLMCVIESRLRPTRGVCMICTIWPESAQFYSVSGAVNSVTEHGELQCSCEFD